jgi:hypothetical protein
MDDWLTKARDAIADAGDIRRADLVVDERTASTLLDLARIAAHVSGDRRNAPLLAYLAGRAIERGADVEDVAAAVRSLV